MKAEPPQAAAFIHRLLSNPALSHFTPLQREDQIVQFLSANARPLHATLSSPAFFPGASWDQIFDILLGQLFSVTNLAVEPRLQQLVNARMQYTFLTALESGNSAPSGLRMQLLQQAGEILKHPPARRDFGGPFAAVEADLPSRYLEQAFERRGYVYIQLTRVQRLRLGGEDTGDLVSAALLLRSAVYLYAPAGSGEESASVALSSVERAQRVLSGQLTSVPDSLLQCALRSHLSAADATEVDPLARLTAIFAGLGRGYRGTVPVDRGADSPDKSWFNIARRNHRFYGFDPEMLEDLFRIAADNGW